MRASRLLGAILLVALGCALVDALLVEPNTFKVVRVEVVVSGVDPRLSGLTIAHLSDLHLRGLGAREEAVIRAVNEAGADLVVVTGDLIDRRGCASLAVEFVRRLRGRLGVYVVFGNWDHWSGVDLERFKRELEEAGAKVLVNEYVVLEYNGTEFVLAGVDDPHTMRDDVDRAVPRGASGLVVLLAHSPEVVDRAVGAGVTLVLCGHTHGGQVVLPLIGPPFLPVSAKYRRYSYGLFRVNGTWMYVSRGLGTSGLPVRFMCPPEVALIRVVVEGRALASGEQI